MISFENHGNFDKTFKFLNFLSRPNNIDSILHHYGEEGVRALSLYTPVDSGQTASMWGYEIHKSHGQYSIVWTNDNINDGVPIAILIQYGHGTGNGGYVSGIDYINPALQNTFSSMTKELWEEVVNA